MRLEPYLTPNLAIILDDPVGKDDVLAALADAAAEALGADASVILDALRAREQQMPTSTPEGVGLPHAMLPGIERTLVIPVRLKPGVKFGAPGHPPADLVFGMFGPDDKPWDHLRILARIARLMRGDDARARLRAARTPDEFAAALLKEDREHE